jgi:hypothetical protein
MEQQITPSKFATGTHRMRGDSQRDSLSGAVPVNRVCIIQPPHLHFAFFGPINKSALGEGFSFATHTAKEALKIQLPQVASCSEEKCKQKESQFFVPPGS